MRPLFVLDLNGTLLERLTTSTAKQAYRLNPHHNPLQPYDLTVNGTQMVLRPFMHDLMRCLSRHGDVAVWTSMTTKNATAICDALFGAYRLHFVWSQVECDIVSGGQPERGFVKPLMRKPLDRIWRAFPGLYTVQNTVMIDDSEAKILEEHKGNHLHITEFDIYHGDFRGDRVLLDLAEYIDLYMHNSSSSSSRGGGGDGVMDYRDLIAKYAASNKHHV